MPKDAELIDGRLAYSMADLIEKISLPEGFLRAEIKFKKLRVHRAGRRVLVLQQDRKDYVEKFWSSK